MFEKKPKQTQKHQSTLGKLPGSWLVDGSDVSSLCCADDSMSVWVSSDDSIPGLQKQLAVSLAFHFVCVELLEMAPVWQPFQSDLGWMNLDRVALQQLE